MNVVSLCSGVGLIDLGLEWAGMRTVQLCELDAYAATVLEHRYPGVPIHDDVWTIEPEECDVIAAGFPCQPFSVAGKQLGDADPRHLWPAIIRAVRMARPRYVILENVPGLVTWGLGEVLGDLAAAGYDAEWTVFGASDVGAPHRRKRWWCVATSDADSIRVWDQSGGFFREGWGTQALTWAHGQARHVANADSPRELQPGRAERDQWGRLGDRSAEGGGVADSDGVGWEGRAGEQWPGRRHEPTDSSCSLDLADSAGEGLQGRAEPETTRPPLGKSAGSGQQTRGGPLQGDRANQVGKVDVARLEESLEQVHWWSAEPDVGRVAHGQPNRMDRLRCLGNGVVPQCAELVGLRMMQLDGVA